MRRLFLFSFLAGFVLSVALAAWFPLPEHQRFPSDIEVLKNGGRQEDFVIRWPQDRLSLPGNADLVAALADSSAFVLAEGSSQALAEFFRLRDAAGNVVGIAARITGRTPATDGETSSDWTLMLPSRGSLLLSQRDSANLMPMRDGDSWRLPVNSRDFWTAGSRYLITSGPASDGRGRILRGTEEFARLTGSYTETWELEELSAEGGTEGRILLSTVTRATR